MYRLLLLSQYERLEVKKGLSQSSISTDDTEDEIRKVNALLRFYFKIDPEVLDDEDWLKRWDELKFALKFEGDRNSL